MGQLILSPICLYDLPGYILIGQILFQCVIFMNGLDLIFFKAVSCTLISVYVKYRLDIHEKKEMNAALLESSSTSKGLFEP